MITWHDHTIHADGASFECWHAHDAETLLAVVSQDQATKRWVICDPDGHRLGDGSDVDEARELAERLLGQEQPELDERRFSWTMIDARTIGCNHRAAGFVGLIRDLGWGEWEAFDDQNESLGKRRGKRRAGALVTDHAIRVVLPELQKEEESEEDMGEDDSRKELYWKLMREAVALDDKIKPLRAERREKIQAAKNLLIGAVDADPRQEKLDLQSGNKGGKRPAARRARAK